MAKRFLTDRQGSFPEPLISRKETPVHTVTGVIRAQPHLERL